jgi:OmpA-OmpF porin, OOP family
MLDLIINKGISLMNMSMKQICSAVSLVAICMSQAQAAVPHVQGKPARDISTIEFPSANKAWRDEGIFPKLESLGLMQTGLTKTEVYQHFGKPHFAEGFFGVKEWNYLMKFNTPQGIQVCQYQIHFSDAKFASSYWDKPECMVWASIAPVTQIKEVEKIVHIQTPAPLPSLAPSSKKITLNADALFAFGKSTRSDITSTGLLQIQGLAAEILKAQSATVYVVGHTDRIGSDSDNLLLSQARAHTVRQVLVEGGVPSNTIRAMGAASTQPIKSCLGQVSPETIACLQPNRRVEVEVIAMDKPASLNLPPSMSFRWQPIVVDNKSSSAAQ